jgi:hypothetical protein
MRTSWRIGVVSLVVLLAILAPARRARAIGEQTGRIKGIVSDAQSGARLPGATVSASSPALIGGARSVITDESGRYELDNLPPGLYRLEISYAGTVANVRVATVQPGLATQVNVAWTAESGATESVRVVERTPLTRPDSTQAGTLLRYPSLAKLPTRRSYQDVTQLVAGVTPDPNPRNPNPNIKGGLYLHNHYLVDGLDITDPVTGTLTSNLTFDATEAVDVLTSGMEAQYNTLGGVINVLTLAGSDELDVNASVYGGLPQLSAKGSNGSALYDGAQPFNTSPSPGSRSLQFNVTAGGPIVKRRLWVSGSYELRLAETSVVKAPPLGLPAAGSPPLGIQHPPLTSVEHLARLKLTYAPNDRHRFNLSGNFNPGGLNNLTGGNSMLGVAENHQDFNSAFGVISWDWLAGRRLSTNLQAGFLWTLLDNGPQGLLGDVDKAGCDQFDPKNCSYDPSRARHVNSVDGTAWYQGGSRQINNRYRVQVDPSVTLRGHLLGRHDAKAGLQLQYSYRTRDFSVPGEFVFTDRTSPPRPLEMGLCDPTTNPDACFARTRNDPFTAHEAGFGAGIYLQDRWWTPLSRLTVVPGLRFDWGRTTDRKGREVSNLSGLAPRLGVVVNLSGDGRSTAFAHYGRYTETISLLTASSVDGVEAGTSETRLWDPAQKSFTTLIDKQGGEGGIIVDHGAKTPHVDEASGGLRAEIAPLSSVELDYTFRHYANLWAAREINAIWDPTGARVVGWLDPQKMNQAVYLFTTPDDNERTYHGFDLIAQGSPTRSWDFGASYTLSWLFGPGNTVFGQNANFSQYDNPRQKRFYDGFLPGDVRHNVKIFGSYTFRDRFSVGLNFAYATGGPLTKTFAEGTTTNYRSPLGTEPGAGNDPQAISEFRMPDRTVVDLRVDCNLLPERFHQKLNLIADIFNAFNTQTPTALESRDIPTFGQATSTRQQPLRIQLALQYLY